MHSHPPPYRLLARAGIIAAAIVAVPSCGGRAGGSTVSDATGEGAGAQPGAPSGATPSSIIYPSGKAACWESQLPPEVQPILPTATVSASCGAASTIAQWNTPIANAGVTDLADGRAAIVGRWFGCTDGGAASSATLQLGWEFGANGRWRHLVTDSSGALVPIPTTASGSGSQGRYYAFAAGQLTLDDDGHTYSSASFIALSPDGNVLEFKPPAQTSGGRYYARTSPSPNNGDDNLPSTTDGTCSMVGTWDLEMTGSSPAATFAFDASGNFVAGPLGSDLCTSHSMYGTYRLSTGMFQITESIGMGHCVWAGDAGYEATFDATCTHLSLMQDYDNCTGARGYFNGQTALTKKP